MSIELLKPHALTYHVTQLINFRLPYDLYLNKTYVCYIFFLYVPHKLICLHDASTKNKMSCYILS